MDKLLLERPPETLHRRVIVTVTLPAHRHLQSKPVHEISVIVGAVLTAPIRVVNQPLSWAFGVYSLKQRLADQISGQPLSHRIADDIAAKEILMASNIQPAFVGGYIGYIACPHFIRGSNRKLLTQNILSYRKFVL